MKVGMPIPTDELDKILNQSVFEFQFEGPNKSVSITIGEDNDLYVVDVLEAVRDILVSGGFDYIDEVRAVNYGERENTIYTSNREDDSWEEPIDVPPPDDLERVMAEETIREAGYDVATAVNLDKEKEWK